MKTGLFTDFYENHILGLWQCPQTSRIANRFGRSRLAHQSRRTWGNRRDARSGGDGINLRGELAFEGGRPAVLRSLGGWFLADDSGIEIDALDGRPGVISARYAGSDCDDEANNDKVLEEMSGVPADRRSCRFRCVLALLGDGVKETFSGACEGTLLFERRGSGGFGYDPLFLPDESESTFAEISLEEKATISHRARALEKLLAWLESTRSN